VVFIVRRSLVTKTSDQSLLIFLKTLSFRLLQKSRSCLKLVMMEIFGALSRCDEASTLGSKVRMQVLDLTKRLICIK